jgi:uracil-DNA glycosylase
MSDAYQQLLEATIQHLERLSACGVRFVPTSPERLAAFDRPPVSPGPKRTQGDSHQAASIAHSHATAPEAGAVSDSTISDRERTGLAPEKNLSPATAVQTELTSGTAPELTPEVKAARFADLRQRVGICVKCPHLASSRKNVVFGVGTIDAQLMFVGEAPGADEDEQGEPFVGKAGQLLTKIIQTMGLGRSDVYIGNILKCRPDTPGQSSGNRKPTGDEMATCLPYLHEQIDLIQPRVLVALGATAVEGLLGKTVGITRLRGAWQTYRGIPLMPTYHPAYLLRNQALSEKRKVWEDMLRVMEKLGMPISEKQRKFFVKG